MVMVTFPRAVMFALVISGALVAPAAVAQEVVAQESVEAELRLLLETAEGRLLRGEVAAAAASFDEVLGIVVEEGEPASLRPFAASARAALLGIELRRGRYEHVRDELERLAAGGPLPRSGVLLRAEALRRLGDHAAAIVLLEQLVAADAGDRQARHELGELHAAAGRRQRARELWQANAEGPPPTDAVGLAFVGRSLFALGGRANLEAASRVLVASLQADGSRPEARITLGLLNFAAYGEARGYPSGEKDLDKVLRQNGDLEEALLAMYRVRSANMVLDAAKTESFLDRVLQQNPRCVPALVLRAANVLDDRRYGDAKDQLDEALAIDPNDRTALSHRMAVAWILGEDRDYERYRERALAGDPGWAEPDRVLGDHLAALYRFADAVPFYEAALKADPDHVPSLHGLARTLVYTGRGKEAKEVLERAKQLQPGFVDPWRNNALAVQDLLDTEYVRADADGFVVQLHRDDEQVLRAYLLPLHVDAKEVLGAKYGWRPDVATTVEVFRTWDDFSVRTIGFRGFTALGACFGRLVTMVSPGDVDLRKQDFMWEATLWHEYTHVLTLGVSRNRVPRWLTEGFSVYEEKVRDPAWERGMDRELFDAFHNQDIPPVHLLNRLFRGPRILFGYYQGGLVVELIAKRYGFEKALELLRAFGDDIDTEEAFLRALGIASREFDRMLLDYVEKEKLRGMRLVPRYDEAAVRRLELRARGAPQDFDTLVQLAWAALQRDNPVDAGRWLAPVLRTDPEHGGGLLVRAAMLAARGETAQAIDCWRRGFAKGADDFDSRLACGDAFLRDGDFDAAIEQYQRAKACWPQCTEQQSAPELRLARLYRERGDDVQAQMEMKAYCRRTARAFQPRWQLAEFEREQGNHQEELRLLVECNRIDPFHRELHVLMADACLALRRKAQAALELEVAAAVRPSQDRRYQRGERPADDGPEEIAARSRLLLRAAALRHELGDRERARELCERVAREAAGTAAGDEAASLLQQWQGR
jgi:tetratricopeptide (TPR) repeat protein